MTSDESTTDSDSSESTATGDSTTAGTTGTERIVATFDTLKEVGDTYGTVQQEVQAERSNIEIATEYVEVLLRWEFSLADIGEVGIAEKVASVAEAAPDESSGVERDVERSENNGTVQIDFRIRHPIAANGTAQADGTTSSEEAAS